MKTVPDAELPKRRSVGGVFLGGLLGLGIAILLNSATLLADAEKLPDGASRSVSLAFWKPIEASASAVGLTWPREALDRLIYGSGDEAEAIFLKKDSVTAIEPQGSDAGIEPSRSNEEPHSSDAADLPISQTKLLAGGEGGEFEVWVLGDSMVQFFGETFVAMAEELPMVDGTSESVLSSGLSRPDYFDWPKRVAEIAGQHNPDVMILMFGGNDAQSIRTAGSEWLPRFSDAWIAEYKKRIGAVMDLVADDDRVVLWVGQPPMKSNEFDNRMQLINELYKKEAATRPGVKYLELRNLFTDEDGDYARYLPDSEGKMVDTRLSDGVHLSHWGGEWLAQLLLDEIRESRLWQDLRSK